MAKANEYETHYPAEATVGDQRLRGPIRGFTEAWLYEKTKNCGKRLIKRRGFCVELNLLEHRRCPSCQTPIDGVWGNESRNVLAEGEPIRLKRRNFGEP